MLVSELLDSIKALEGYVTNSLYLKSSDNTGGTYKYLIKENAMFTYAQRHQIFIAAEGAGTFEERIVITSIEVHPAE